MSKLKASEVWEDPFISSRRNKQIWTTTMRKRIKCRVCGEEFFVKCSREGQALEDDICPSCYEDEKQWENNEDKKDCPEV